MSTVNATMKVTYTLKLPYPNQIYELVSRYIVSTKVRHYYALKKEMLSFQSKVQLMYYLSINKSFINKLISPFLFKIVK